VAELEGREFSNLVQRALSGLGRVLAEAVLRRSVRRQDLEHRSARAASR